MYHNAPGLYFVCTRYILICTWKNKKQMSITLGIEQWISCIATGELYNNATSMHSMVICKVNTRYILTETYTRVAQYLLAGIRRPARVPQRPRLRPWSHWSRQHRLEFPRCPCWLCKRLTLKEQVGCKTLPAYGVQAGTDPRPSHSCAALSDSE
jgi:hypothetical protein